MSRPLSKMIMHDDHIELNDAYQRFITDWKQNSGQFNAMVKNANNSKLNSEEWHRINAKYKIDQKINQTKNQMMRNGQLKQMQQMVHTEKNVMRRVINTEEEKLDIEGMEARYEKQKNGSYVFNKKKCLDRISKPIKLAPLKYTFNKEFIEIQ